MVFVGAVVTGTVGRGFFGVGGQEQSFGFLLDPSQHIFIGHITGFVVGGQEQSFGFLFEKSQHRSLVHIPDG